MFGRPLHAVLIAAAAILAGCVSEPVTPGGMDASSAGPSGPPEMRTLFLTGAPGLAADAPVSADPEVVRGGNFFTRWGKATGYAEFVGAPMEESLLVTGNVTLTAFARAEGPAAQAGVFPHFIAYFGSAAALNADGAGNAEAVMLPGDEVEFSVTIAPPPAGFLLEKGERPRVLLVAVMTQDDAADVAFLVNSTAAPSRVEFEAARVADPPALGDYSGTPVEGALVGSAYAATQEGASQMSYPLEVPANATRVDVTLQVQAAAGFGDLDLAILGPDGAEVARSVTPMGLERIVLYPEHLGEGGAFTVTVTNYGSAAATYVMEPRVYVGASGTGS